MNKYLKWSLLVGINTILSLFFAFEFMQTIQGALGVILGIITFILLYILLDTYIERKKKARWRKSLFIGVSLFSLTQLFPPIVMISGAASLEASRKLFGLSKNADLHFLATYATTIIDGFILSVMVLGLVLIIRLIFWIIDNWSTKNKESTG